jgi:hypothetical protein
MEEELLRLEEHTEFLPRAKLQLICCMWHLFVSAMA